MLKDNVLLNTKLDLFSKILSENILEFLSCNLKHFNGLIIVCLVFIMCLCNLTHDLYYELLSYGHYFVAGRWSSPVSLSPLAD